MANEDKPRGLFPAYHKLGGQWQASTYTAGGQIFKGDAVTLAADGDLEAATPGARLFGVAESFAATDGDAVQVINDPLIVYRIQQDASATIAEADFGQFADIATETAGDALTSLSGMELDAATAGTGSAQLRVEQQGGTILVNTPDNAIGVNAELYVSLFEHHDMVVSAAATVDLTPGV